MKKLILFGAGTFGVKWLNRFGVNNIYAFGDSDIRKVGNEINGKKILSIEEICNIDIEKMIFISTSNKYKKEIEELLTQYGLQEYIISMPHLNMRNRIESNATLDNETILEGNNVILNQAYIERSYIGYSSYISTNSQIITTKIGRYCSIAPNVRIIRGQHPSKMFVSTYPGFYDTDNEGVIESFVTQNIFDEYRYAEYPYSVVIGNDVWIGLGSNIMEGITIADGTIIAAGAMVVKDTEPYTIVGGVPAKKIGERFDNNEKEFLLNLKWWNKSDEWIKQYAYCFNNVYELKKILEVENKVNL